MRLSLLMLFLTSACMPVSGQEYFLYDSDCNASSESLHLTDDGDAILVVEESCPQQTFETVICTPQDDGSLEPALNLPFERPGPIYSTGDGFYMLSGNDDVTYLRFISNNLEILSEIELSIPWYCKQLHVQDNYLITGYDGLGGVFNLVRLNVSNGQIEEEVAIPALTSAFPENTELIAENDETFYLGLDCSNRFEFDPLDLASAIIHPLPVDDQTGEPFSTCSDFLDVFREHPSPVTLWAVSSSYAALSEQYTMYFAYDGSYLGFDSFTLPEDLTPVQFAYAESGERYFLFSRAGESYDSRDAVIYTFDANNNTAETEVYETPALNEWASQLVLSEDHLHLFGYEGLNPEQFERKALYIRIDLDNLTNVQEPEQADYTFIQTEEAFGVRTNGVPLQQDIYSMTGRLLFSERRTDLWSKSTLPPGTYVLKVVTDDRISSHLVVVR
jgi:hypothetical protein